MVDAWGWAALAVAWLSALSGERVAEGPSTSCHCNCTCEVEPVTCPAVGSWTGELVKWLILLFVGVIIGCGWICKAALYLGQLVTKVFDPQKLVSPKPGVERLGKRKLGLP